MHMFIKPGCQLSLCFPVYHSCLSKISEIRYFAKGALNVKFLKSTNVHLQTHARGRQRCCIIPLNKRSYVSGKYISIWKFRVGSGGRCKALVRTAIHTLSEARKIHSYSIREVAEPSTKATD